ncbi:hypothetical protein PMG11_01188 [Penicillium brasilianum]|uniref:P-type ATPase A domain-containing protein n=1 Tax=Penicillium brasilianum TaxID=104259 RepID=A0A0F7TED6_PENBI|nr:hypothetical protein PMG11_01188 [Penicillium brasilianum]
MRISDLTVGDIVCLEPGDTAPADGIVLANYEIKGDESLATGESDQVEKWSGFKYLNTMIFVIQIKTKRVTNVKLRYSQVDNDLIWEVLFATRSYEPGRWIPRILLQT